MKYFLDELQTWEAVEILNNLEFTDKNERELLRAQLYVSVQSNSKKKIEAKEIWKLPWDEIHRNEDYDEKEAKRLKEQSQEFENLLNSGKIKFDFSEDSAQTFGDIALKTKIPKHE